MCPAGRPVAASLLSSSVSSPICSGTPQIPLSGYRCCPLYFRTHLVCNTSSFVLPQSYIVPHLCGTALHTVHTEPLLPHGGFERITSFNSYKTVVAYLCKIDPHTSYTLWRNSGCCRQLGVGRKAAIPARAAIVSSRAKS